VFSMSCSWFPPRPNEFPLNAISSSSNVVSRARLRHCAVDKIDQVVSLTAPHAVDLFDKFAEIACRGANTGARLEQFERGPPILTGVAEDEPLLSRGCVSFGCWHCGPPRAAAGKGNRGGYDHQCEQWTSL